MEIVGNAKDSSALSAGDLSPSLQREDSRAGRAARVKVSITSPKMLMRSDTKLVSVSLVAFCDRWSPPE
jgi:hypothetical protein